MDIRKLQRVIVDGLEDVKAQNIVVFNTEHLSSLFERVIVASGTSNRQTKSLAASVRDAVKAAGAPPPRTEGEANGEWIIVDCGAAVVHVMQPAIREYYHLEELWGEKPVKMKIDSAKPRLVKASPAGREPAAARESAAPRLAPSAKRATPAKRATRRRRVRPRRPSGRHPRSGRRSAGWQRASTSCAASACATGAAKATAARAGARPAAKRSTPKR